MGVPSRSAPASHPAAPPPLRRLDVPGQAPRPFRDNTRLIVFGIIALLGVLGGLLILAGQSSSLAPDFLTEFVLYALLVTDVAMLAALTFVLARNIVKLVVEHRRALPFARFRVKLVAVLLGMTLIPAVLVLIVGSELIRTSVDRWFDAPMEEALSSATAVAGDLYQERQTRVRDAARRAADALAGMDLAAIEAGTVALPTLLASARDGEPAVHLFRRTDAGVVRVGASVSSGPAADTALRLAQGAIDRHAEAGANDRLDNARDLMGLAVPLPGADGQPAGAVVATDVLGGEVALRARRVTGAYEAYQQARVLRQPLTAVYLSFFVMLTLLILVAATWMGLYLAKRITRPVQMLAAAAREIGAGHLDHRLVRETADEFGSLIDAFNSMATELAANRRRLERTALDVERKHQDVEARRRYIETILERVATGVISVDETGALRTVNPAAARLLGLAGDLSNRPVAAIFGHGELRPLADLIEEAARSRKEVRPREIGMTLDGRELHLSVVTTPLVSADGQAEGVVLVFDDVTPLIRAQKVAAWREVARRLAHEIKNPLTPIQLCAERLRRHFSGAPDATRALVDECTTTIVGEVDSLKGLVDEFAQFARMPAPRAVPTDLHRLVNDVLALNDGLLTDVRVTRRFAGDLPPVSADPEQIRRVVQNVMDNAIEAMDRKGEISVETEHDAGHSLVRLVIADQGPGIPASEREKLFLPYYSTKRRGSGLGLAIVRRIVAEHGGSIDLSDNTPTGTRFAIELPCA
jgi:two-component system nitrogen regulation sensor histidine kinase NtrY